MHIATNEKRSSGGGQMLQGVAAHNLAQRKDSMIHRVQL
jgi:hypothetical protein